MKLSKSIKVGALLIIFLNLIMAVGSIWVFQRMTPSIENIINQNGRSLQASESMLSLLAERDLKTDREGLMAHFHEQMEIAKNNVTEASETEPLEIIESNYVAAFRIGGESLKATLKALEALQDVNWNATYKADLRAKQIGNAGAWGVCFMGIFVFVAAIVFKRRVERNLLEPFEEIASVLSAQSKGDVMRRCTRYSSSTDVKKVYAQINDWIDRHERSDG